MSNVKNDGVNVMVLDGSETSLVGGWYMVNSNITFDRTLTFSGDAHLILANGNHGVNWYELAEDSYTLKANNAYLRLPADDAPSAARQLTVIFSDEATGMSGISGKSGMCGDWYDLSGRRLSSEPTKKGIYIYKGVKVVKE